jgi:hypothetical protein
MEAVDTGGVPSETGTSIANGCSHDVVGVVVSEDAGRTGTDHAGSSADAAGRSAMAPRLAAATKCRAAGRARRARARYAQASAAISVMRRSHHASDAAEIESSNDEMFGVMVIVLPCARVR